MPERAGVLLVAFLAACPSDDAEDNSASTSSATNETSGTTPAPDAPASTSGVPSDASSSGPDAVDTGTPHGQTSSSGEASTGSTGEPSAPPPPAFIATGDMGRSTISCDLGYTWTQERSFDLEDGHEFLCDTPGPVTCNVTSCMARGQDGDCDVFDTCDCLHHPGNSRGGAITDAGTVVSWGWFRPGPTRRTDVGAAWTTVFTEPRGAVGGVASGHGLIMLAVRQPSAPPYTMLSVDGGHRWQEGPLDGVTAAVRDADWVDVGDGLFVVYSDNEIVLSSDEGLSWYWPETQPSECFGNLRSILGGDDTLVLLGSQDYACTSTDGGLSWTAQPLGVTGDGAWTGTQFISYDNGITHTSPDGLSWTAVETPDEPLPFTVRAAPDASVVVAATGTYDTQQFMRSADGVHWELLPPEAFHAGHRVSYIDVGPATGLCDGG